jgi:adenosine deaminase
MPIDWTSFAKVSLHDHLDGSLRLDTVLELSQAAGLKLPADDIEGLRAWINARSLSGNLVEYLSSFSITSAVVQTSENLERVAREYVLDLAADGIVYAEVRWAPEKSTDKGLAPRAAVEAVSSGLRTGERDARERGHEITVRQILSAMRHEQRVPEIAQLALDLRDTDVVAFDLAGPEAGFPPSLFEPTLERLAREWMPVTLHAGEADGLASIASALVDGRALRLGHGTRMIDDVTLTDGEPVLGRLAEWVRDRGIVLELSPTSNFHTAAFTGASLAEHPFAVLDRAGFRVTVNTDNRLMSDTTLSAELEKLSDAFGFGLDDHERFQLNAARGAFLPEPERRGLEARVHASFAALDSSAKIS